jgi:hypothetical protein
MSAIGSPPLVLFSESFTGTAKSKLEFLQGMGGRVVSLVLEDCDGMTATIDRWGRVTWADKSERVLGIDAQECSGAVTGKAEGQS